MGRIWCAAPSTALSCGCLAFKSQDTKQMENVKKEIGEVMSEQYKILVVDDDPSIVNIIETALGEAGYAVLTASNGEQAVQR